MKKAKVVQLQDLISHFGEDRILEILSSQEALKKEIKTLEKPVWTEYFNLQLTAYILSFAFETPAQALVIWLVCKYWAQLCDHKTFWRRFFDMKLTKIAKTFHGRCNIFHSLIWPERKKDLVLGKIWRDFTGTTESVHIKWKKRYVEFFVDRRTSLNTISKCKKTTQHCKHKLCGGMIVTNATRLLNFKNGNQQVIRGTFCCRCSELTDKNDFDVIQEVRSEEAKSHLIKTPYFNPNFFMAKGIVSFREFKLKGFFLLKTATLESIFYRGDLIISNNDKIYHIHPGSKEFWETYILGLKSQENATK